MIVMVRDRVIIRLRQMVWFRVSFRIRDRTHDRVWPHVRFRIKDQISSRVERELG